MLTLDFISLLLSKETPVQAGLTLSDVLRSTVGIGTLGADKLAASNMTDEKVQDNKLVATGWKFVEINNTVESLMHSATRLQKEIDLETKYWGEVLAASENGWAVSRLPHERHTLGVKYGFEEAALYFRANSFAPMRRSDTGSVSLDTNRIGKPRRLAATIKQAGKIVGRSSPRQPLRDDAPLEARVRQARDSIFDQELWHELNREGRTLLSYGVRLEDGSISLAVDDREVVLSLDYIEAESMPEAHGTDSASALAETTCATLRLLLSYAHKQNNQKRSRPNPLGSSANRGNMTYSLLRPLLLHFKHEQSVKKATQFVSDLVLILRAAGVVSAQYTLTEPPAPALSPNLSSSEALYIALLSPRDFLFDVTISPEVRLTIRGKTTVVPTVTQYLIQLPLANAPQDLPSPDDLASRNYLLRTFPPAESYPDLREAASYTRQAVARYLAFKAESIAQDADSSPKGGSGRALWARSLNGRAIHDVPFRKRELQIDVCKPHSPDRWDEKDELDDPSPGQEGDLTPELRVYASWTDGDDQDGGSKVYRKWTFSAGEARTGAPILKLENIVRGCVSDQLKPALGQRK